MLKKKSSEEVWVNPVASGTQMSWTFVVQCGLSELLGQSLRVGEFVKNDSIVFHNDPN